MDAPTPAIITIAYSPARLRGRFILTKNTATSAVWEHLKLRAYNDADATVEPQAIEMPWPAALDVIREFGTKAVQRSLNFRFAVDASANKPVSAFAAEVRTAKAARDTLTITMSAEEIVGALKVKGFTKRDLQSFQIRDLQHLLALPHGANFSVPGAGKTSVAFALHILTRKPGQHLLVIAPKSAFGAWREVISEWGCWR